MARSVRVLLLCGGMLLAVLEVGCHAVAPAVIAPATTPAPVLLARPQAPALPGASVPAQAPPATAGVPTTATASAVRVLLRTGDTIVLPEPGRRYRIEGSAGGRVIRGPIGARLLPGVPAVQVGAFKDPANAEAMGARLRRAGIPAEVRRARDGLQAVVALGEPGEPADALAARLRGAGIERVVPLLSDGEIELTDESGAAGRARRFVLRPLDDRPVDTGDARVRGGLELLASSDGVALVNVLPLEEYLRGVVPAEMGPRAFPALEALKAQAVAARTYVVAHLGEYGDRGYDICATTACQVYQGVGVEHPLSDRAVAETAGLVATWNGRPIDAMYHSTCAGHTEDAAALLPERAAPYLIGVPCRGERSFSIGAGGGEWLSDLERLALVAERVAGVLGAKPDARGLASALGAVPEGGSRAGLASDLRLGEAAAVLASEGGFDGAALVHLFGLSLPPPDRSIGPGRFELAHALRLAQLAGAVEERGGKLVSGPAGVVFVADGDGGAAVSLTGSETVLERRDGRYRIGRAAGLSGSPATLWCVASACPVLEVSEVADADWRSSWRSWIREMPLTEAGTKLGVGGLEGVLVDGRGQSGRVTRAVLLTAGGKVPMPGFELRLRLGLPDTLFAVFPVDRQGERRLRFLGRGWGHGIGMCQNGAYGLAVGGASFDEILKTYYTGIAVEKWSGGSG